MTLLVIWLFVEAQRAVKREMRQTGQISHTLRRERCAYVIITFFFGLSYFGRFFINEYVYCAGNNNWSWFTWQMTWASVFLLEGASLGVLMWFHFMNFKHGSLLSSVD